VTSAKTGEYSDQIDRTIEFFKNHPNDDISEYNYIEIMGEHDCNVIDLISVADKVCTYPYIPACHNAITPASDSNGPLMDLFSVIKKFDPNMKIRVHVSLHPKIL
jgi:homospermidine synthase